MNLNIIDRLPNPEISEKQLGILLVLPTILLVVVLIVFPLLYSLYLGFFEATGLSLSLSFVGLENYVALFTESQFWNALVLNIFWAVGTLSLQIVLGVGIALLLNQGFRGRNIVRGAVLFPYMVPTIVAVFNFQWMLNSTYGVVNYILETLGVISQPIAFFSYDLAMVTAILLGVWRFTPFVIITVLARLQTIPPSLYEAAELDGAYTLARFRYVTLPQLYNVLAIVILLRGVWMFYKFAPIYLLTGGGPGTSTQILPIYVYQQAYSSLNFGFASSIANVMFFGMLIFGFIYIFKFQSRGGAESNA